ncbi:aminopeptidase PaaP [Dactylosporangium matsuzakiense]|uniref:Aminopeptidase n=1 Tax=Dactylosporangium matsuzakiense TaxID=53360 RepID=A0A9W6KR23_9ACTN|nr:aminopeptidase [Dactylosporangium matsuzakiense]
MRRVGLVAAAVIIVALIGAPPAAAGPPDVDSGRLERLVTVEGILDHQRALQRIADRNGGTRSTRSPGYTASAAYVKATLEKAGYNAHYEMFSMPLWRENAAPVLQQTSPTGRTYVAGSAGDDDSPSVDFIAFEHTPTASLTNVKVVPTDDIVIPSPGGTTSGCELADFPAATRGAVSLIQRGTCAFTQKLENAVQAGAAGVIVFNEGDTPGRSNALFRSAPFSYPLPAVVSSFAVGQELYNAYKAGRNPTVNLATNGFDEEKLYPNVVAETRRGDPNHVVLLGAHLDSVPAGPGVNDDGSGTAFQLELAEQLAKAGAPPRNKIRFLWFGGEEDGLVGSQYYAAHLSAGEVARTDMMLDTDMIASPNFARLVYDGDGSTFGSENSGPEGSGTIERVLTEYWAQRGMVSEPIPFDGRSDYVGFVNRGIPAGGVFAGAEAPKTAEQVARYGGVLGEQLDPCYHEDCDTYSTVTRQPPASTMLTYATNPALAQQQADSLRGNALRSLQQFKNTLVHAVWYFARARNAFPPKANAAAATTATSGHQFKYRGHERTRDR